MDISRLSLEQKQLLLSILEADLGLKSEDLDIKENPYTIETRKCNEIALLKRAGKSVIYTELQ